jgi:hypothetical protein
MADGSAGLAERATRSRGDGPSRRQRSSAAWRSASVTISSCPTWRPRSASRWEPPSRVSTAPWVACARNWRASMSSKDIESLLRERLGAGSSRPLPSPDFENRVRASLTPRGTRIRRRAHAMEALVGTRRNRWPWRSCRLPWLLAPRSGRAARVPGDRHLSSPPRSANPTPTERCPRPRPEVVPRLRLPGRVEACRPERPVDGWGSKPAGPFDLRRLRLGDHGPVGRLRGIRLGNGRVRCQDPSQMLSTSTARPNGRCPRAASRSASFVASVAGMERHVRHRRLDAPRLHTNDGRRAAGLVPKTTNSITNAAPILARPPRSSPAPTRSSRGCSRPSTRSTASLTIDAAIRGPNVAADLTPRFGR